MRKNIGFISSSIVVALLVSTPAAIAVVNGQPDPVLARNAVMVLDDHGNMCTGAVIAPTAILTAAHCVTEGSTWRVHWRAPDGTPILIIPKAVRVHPGYRPEPSGKAVKSIDLAVVTLSDPLPSPFEPIALSDAPSVTAGDLISVAGYGYSEEKNRKTLGTFRRADLAVIEPFGHSSILVWLSDPNAGGAGGCQGDSGGPLIYQGALLAITFVTTGVGQHNCGALTQGTLIAPQRDWIAKAMQP